MLNKFAAIVCIVDVSAIRFDVLSSSSGVEFLFFISFRYEQDDDNTNWMANDILDNFLGAMKHTIFYTLYLFVMTINTEKRKKKMIRIIFWPFDPLKVFWNVLISCSALKFPSLLTLTNIVMRTIHDFEDQRHTARWFVCVCVSCLFETVATAVHKIIIITRFGQKHIYSPWCASSLWCHRTTWLCGKRMGN